ncbi:MAG: alpha/beta hydrolase [Candidatus Sericytochromatia bacterium]
MSIPCEETVEIVGNAEAEQWVRSPGEDWQPLHRENSLNGHFVLHRNFRSRFLEAERDIMIYLPPSYKENAELSYPVLYMQDGNNLFDAAEAGMGVEWQVDEHMESLVAQGAIEEALIVGIYNTADRDFEYTWNTMRNEDGEFEGGGGPRYARFLVEELKPFIDETYRTRPERESTCVAGSSLGGLISFYLALYYPDVFSRVGIVSPSLWWNHRQPLSDVSGLQPELLIWVDTGTEEGQDPRETVETTLEFVESMTQKGYIQGENLLFWLAQGGDHSEKAWSERVQDMLCFFFKRAA